MSGYYLIHRGSMDHPVFQGDTFSRWQAWCWLIEEAAFQPMRKRVDGNIVTLERGQLCHAIRFMAEAWGWGHDKVHRFIKELEKEGMVSRTKIGRRSTVLTICNYDDYQRSSDGRKADNRTSSRTIIGQSSDKDRTNEKEGNELKALKCRGSNEPSSPSDVPGAPSQTHGIAAKRQTAERMMAVFAEEVGDAISPGRLTDNKAKSLTCRLKDDLGNDYEQWRWFCRKVRASPFLMGRKTDFQATLNWLIKPTNFEKVMDGDYDPKPDDQRSSPSGGEQRNPFLRVLEADYRSAGGR